MGHCNLAKNKSLSVRVVRGPICLALGSNSFVRPRSISVVPSLAAAIFDVGLDAADHYLDCEHYPGIRPVALARTGATVGGPSGLGDGSGIRVRGDRCRDYFHTPYPAIARRERS